MPVYEVSRDPLTGVLEVIDIEYDDLLSMWFNEDE